MTNICLLEAFIVIDEVWLPREFENRTASVISFVLYRDKSRTKTMKNDSGIYVSSLTTCNTYRRTWWNTSFSAAPDLYPPVVYVWTVRSKWQPWWQPFDRGREGCWSSWSCCGFWSWLGGRSCWGGWCWWGWSCWRGWICSVEKAEVGEAEAVEDAEALEEAEVAGKAEAV